MGLYRADPETLESVRSTVNTGSANWDSTYTTVFANSAAWSAATPLSANDTRYVNITGDTMTGTLSVLNEGSSTEWKSAYTTINSISGDHRDFKEPLTTGFLSTPPILSVNGTDNTKFDMTSATLLYVDTSIHPHEISEITINAVVSATDPFLNTDSATFVSIGSAGVPDFQTVQATPERRRDFAQVGILSHPSLSTIEVVINQPINTESVAGQVHDLMRAIGFFSTSGNQVEGKAGTLQLKKSAGGGFSLSENAANNNKDPHNFSMAALDPMVMFQITQTTTIHRISADIDPTVYDNAGVVTTVPANNNATIARIYAFPNNQIVYMLGQEVFANLSDAKDKAGKETFVETNDIATGGLLLGRLVIRKSATDVTDISEAEFIPSAAISGGGATLTSLQQAYEISTEPEVTLNATRGGLTLKSYVGGNNTNTYEGVNEGGDTTFSVKGTGQISVTGAGTSDDWYSSYTTVLANSAAWSAATPLSANDTRYVNLTGDTMTGGLSAPTFNDVAITATGGGNLFLADDGTYKVVVENAAVAGTINPTTSAGSGVFYADIVHNLGSNDVVVEVYDPATNKTVFVEEIERVDTNTVRISVVGDGLTLRVVVIDGLPVVDLGRTTVKNPTSPYTPSKREVILWDASGGNKKVLMPAASALSSFTIDVKKIDSSLNTVVIDASANGGTTIDDGAIAVISNQYESITIYCDGTEYWIL